MIVTLTPEQELQVKDWVEQARTLTETKRSITAKFGDYTVKATRTKGLMDRFTLKVYYRAVIED